MGQARLRLAPEAVVAEPLEQVGRQHAEPRPPLHPAADLVQPRRAQRRVERLRLVGDILEVVAEQRLAQQPIQLAHRRPRRPRQRLVVEQD